MLHQLRYAIRGFLRRPAFAAALIFSVALGVGGNAVVLGFMNGLVSREIPLPPAPGLPVTVLAQHEGGLGPLTVAQFESLRASKFFEPVIAIVETRNPVRAAERNGVATVATVSPGAIELLGLPQGDGVVLSVDFATQHFTREELRQGRRIVVDGTDYPVVGVAARTLDGIYVGRPIDIWRIAEPPQVSAPTLSIVGRLRPDVSLREAQRAIASDLVIAEYTGLPPEMQSAMNRLNRLMPMVSGAVFLIACANVAVLLLSRAARESRDTAVRMAIGATHLTLAQAALIGSAVIAVAGAAAGALVALWTSDILPALLFSADAERLSFVADNRGMIVTTLLSALVIVACGAAPILENRRDTPARVLSREADRPSGALGTVRKALVVFQMAVCCVLVIGSITVSDALSASLQTAAGRRLDDMMLITVRSQYDFARQDLGLDYFRTVEQTLLQEPAILAGAWTAALPGSRPLFHTMTVEPPSLPTRGFTATASVFTADTLDVVQVPPLHGRMFDGADTRGGCNVAIVSESVANGLSANTPVGRLLIDRAQQTFEIIGVVAPKQVGARRAQIPDVYFYSEQAPEFFAERRMSFDVVVVPPPVTAMVDVRVVTPGYFELTGLTTLAGETFADKPVRNACRVGVVNEAAAQLYFGGAAVGGALIDARGHRTTIVGVVRDASVRATLRGPEPTLYLPLEQDFTARMHLLLSATDTGGALQERLLRLVRAIEGGKVDEIVVMPLEDRLRQTAFAFERIAALLLSVASLNALALAVIGLCRIVADDVLERQREMAVRSALGAQGWRLVLLVMRRAGRLAGFGILAGTLSAVLFVRWIGAVTGLETAAFDWIWVAGPAVIAVATLFASLLPARRILRLDPLTAMRTE